MTSYPGMFRRGKRRTRRKIRRRTRRKIRRRTRRKRKHNKKKTRKKRGGQKSLVDYKVAAKIAAALKESNKDKQFTDDATRLLQGITTNQHKEEESLDNESLMCKKRVGTKNIEGFCGKDIDRKVLEERLQQMKNIRKTRTTMKKRKNQPLKHPKNTFKKRKVTFQQQSQQQA